MEKTAIEETVMEEMPIGMNRHEKIGHIPKVDQGQIVDRKYEHGKQWPIGFRLKLI